MRQDRASRPDKIIGRWKKVHAPSPGLFEKELRSSKTSVKQLEEGRNEAATTVDRAERQSAARY